MREGIYWLASFPKSGNTWLRIFLTNYLRIPEESDEFDINNLERTVIASARPIFDTFAGIESGHLTYEEIDRHRPDVYRRWAEARANALDEDGLMVSKVHDAYTYLPNGEPMFPLEATAGVIYIIRNPLDVAVSYAHHGSISIERSIATLASNHHALSAPRHGQGNQLRQRLLTWSNHVRSWNVPNIPRLVVRYEDMTFKPLETFRAVVRFLQQEEDMERIEEAIELSSFDRVKSLEEETGFREKPYRMETFFRKGKVGNWREHLTPEHVGQLIFHHGDVMRQYMYLRSTGEIVF